MRAISLFAGIGGFDLALERVGVEVAAMVEIDKACQSVLRRHFPKARGFADIKSVDGRKLGNIDLVVGGFPCQDVSVAGKRAGLAGERTGLFFEAVRIINETTPQYVVLENVPGLLSSNAGRDMATVLGTLEELGYGVAYRILDARYFGVAQRRRRVFIVASLGDWDGPREILFEPESLRGDSAPSKEPRARVAGTLTASLASGGPGSAGQSGNSVTSRVVETASTLTSDGKGPRGRHLSSEMMAGGHIQVVEVAGTLSGGAHPGGFNGQDAYTGLLQVSPTLVGGSNNPASHGKQNGSDRGALVVSTLQAGGGKRGWRVDVEAAAGGHIVPVATSVDIYSGTVGDELSVTVTAASARQNAAGTPAIMIQRNDGLAVRRLTPTECERLQGFPDDWTAGQSDAQRYRQLGNAVAVPVVEWIARRLVAFDTARSDNAID